MGRGSVGLCGEGEGDALAGVPAGAAEEGRLRVVPAGPRELRGALCHQQRLDQTLQIELEGPTEGLGWIADGGGGVADGEAEGLDEREAAATDVGHLFNELSFSLASRGRNMPAFSLRHSSSHSSWLSYIARSFCTCGLGCICGY